MKKSEYSNDATIYFRLDRSLCVCAYQVASLMKNSHPRVHTRYKYDWVHYGTHIEKLKNKEVRLIFTLITANRHLAVLEVQLRRLGPIILECYSKSLSGMIAHSFMKIKSNGKLQSTAG